MTLGVLVWDHIRIRNKEPGREPNCGRFLYSQVAANQWFVRVGIILFVNIVVERDYTHVMHWWDNAKSG